MLKLCGRVDYVVWHREEEVLQYDDQPRFSFDHQQPET